jgi:hypothetical protein
MTQDLNWRSPNFAGAFDNYDRADFAQEFLRRNPDYRQHYEETDICDVHSQESLTQIANSWGLLSRLRP